MSLVHFFIRVGWCKGDTLRSYRKASQSRQSTTAGFGVRVYILTYGPIIHLHWESVWQGEWHINNCQVFGVYLRDFLSLQQLQFGNNRDYATDYFRGSKTEAQNCSFTCPKTEIQTLA